MAMVMAAVVWRQAHFSQSARPGNRQNSRETGPPGASSVTGMDDFGLLVNAQQAFSLELKFLKIGLDWIGLGSWGVLTSPMDWIG